MHRRIILFLLGAAPGLFGASGIEPGLFTGSWSVTNRQDFVISGTLGIEFPESGRPTVHFYFPVFTNETVEVVPYSKTAARPTRRSIAWTVPGFVRLHGVRQVDGATETISGPLRLRGGGDGAFTVERLGVILTNAIHITNFPPRTITNLPPRPPIVVLPPSPPLPPIPGAPTHQTNIIIFPPLIFLSNAPPIIRVTDALPAVPPEVTDPAEINARIDMFLRRVKRSQFILPPSSPQFRKL